MIENDRGNDERTKASPFTRLVFASILALLLVVSFGFADPQGPTISVLSNSTRTGGSGTLVNNTIGGEIYTVVVNATTQNTRWKAFVGNVSGKLALDNANGESIYQWNTTENSGEVFATRFDSTITWSQVECANATTIGNEDVALNHTREDNITTTFSTQNHDAFFIGTSLISASSCFSISTYINDSAQSADFQEIALQDGSGGEFILATIMENGVVGYDGGAYDFQMILPENGTPGYTGSLAYYFYVELG